MDDIELLERPETKEPVMDDKQKDLKSRFLANPQDHDNVLNIAKEMDSDELRTALAAYFCLQSEQGMSFEEKDKIRISEITERYKPLKMGEDEKLTFEKIRAHFKKNFQHDLKYFGAKENRVYLDELRKIEPLTPQIYSKLYGLHKYKKSIPELKDIVPTRDIRTSKRLKSKSKEEINRSVKDVSANQRRKEKPQQNPLELQA